MNKTLIASLAIVTVACGSEVTTRPATTPPKTTPTPAPSVSFDVEDWRRDTIELFGPEKEYADGSKLDYVKVARALCEKDDRPDYEDGSLQEHILDTFCPNV